MQLHAIAKTGCENLEVRFNIQESKAAGAVSGTDERKQLPGGEIGREMSFYWLSEKQLLGCVTGGHLRYLASGKALQKRVDMQDLTARLPETKKEEPISSITKEAEIRAPVWCVWCSFNSLVFFELENTWKMYLTQLRLLYLTAHWVLIV